VICGFSYDSWFRHVFRKKFKNLHGASGGQAMTGFRQAGN
jgi:hypothetical protein